MCKEGVGGGLVFIELSLCRHRIGIVVREREGQWRWREQGCIVVIVEREREGEGEGEITRVCHLEREGEGMSSLWHCRQAIWWVIGEN